MRIFHFAIAFCVLLTFSEASAQILTPPPRSSDGLFGGTPTRPDQAAHELSADMIGLGSYEDNLSGGVGGVSGPDGGGINGMAGVFSANLRYRYGRVRYFEAGSSGYAHSFRNLEGPMYGGSANVRAGSNLGRKASFSVGASAQYQPTFMLTADPAVPGSPGDVIPPSDPTSGIVDLESTNGTLTSMLDFAWNAHHSTSSSFGYQLGRMQGLLETTDSWNHGQLLSHSWGVSRTVAVHMEYQHSHQSVESATQPARPTDSHTARVNLEWRKRVSPRRTLSFGGGSGAIRISTISVLDNSPFEYVAPSFSGRARLDLGRTWAASVDARRDVTVLEGVSRQSFLTDVGTLWLGGNFGESWVFSLNGSFTRGKPHEGELGSMEATTAVAQLQYAFAECCTFVGTYSRYTHFLRDLASLSPGFPNRAERTAVRVGMTLWLPVYGRFSGTRQFQTGRN